MNFGGIMVDLLKEELNSVFLNLQMIKEYLSKESEKIVKVGELCAKCLRKGNKIFVFGNGGSAADAQHFAAEIVGRYKRERIGFPAIALSTDTSVLTSVGNDYGFERIFERQILALGKKGDIALGISTSGNSENVLLALKAAKRLELRTVALLGGDGGIIKDEGEITIIYPTSNTPRVQEFHSVFLHIIAHFIEEKILLRGRV